MVRPPSFTDTTRDYVVAAIMAKGVWFPLLPYCFPNCTHEIRNADVGRGVVLEL